MEELKSSTLLKVFLLHRCFQRFLNGANGAKSRKASHIVKDVKQQHCHKG